MKAKRYLNKRDAIGYETAGSVVKFERVGSEITCFGRYLLTLDHKQARTLSVKLGDFADAAELAKRGAE